MSAIPVQAIPGVSANRENVVMTAYPSIAGMGVGRAIGALMLAVPVKLWNVRMPAFLFWIFIAPIAAVLWITIGLTLAPLAVLLFAIQRLGGDKYVLTNRSVQVWKTMGKRLVFQVPLNQIERIDVTQSGSQKFFRAVDLYLMSGSNVLGQLNAVPNGTVFKEIILKARDARRHVDSTMANLSKRTI